MTGVYVSFLVIILTGISFYPRDVYALMYSPRDKGLGLEAPGGQKRKSVLVDSSRGRKVKREKRPRID